VASNDAKRREAHHGAESTPQVAGLTAARLERKPLPMFHVESPLVPRGRSSEFLQNLNILIDNLIQIYI
jgi:hypothetical protein